MSESFSNLASIYRARIDILGSRHDEPLNANLIKKVENYKATTFIYVETHSGLINKINAVSEIVEEKEPLFIVDAVSVVGTLPINRKTLGVYVCVMVAIMLLVSFRPGYSCYVKKDKRRIS